MGRRSINTTKSGKYMNPTDQARKEARKQELKKNKKQRQMVRAAVLKGKDPIQILDELEKIDQMEFNVNQPSPLNEKVLKDKRKKLRDTLERVLNMYYRDDPDKWADLKRKQTDYEHKRNQIVSFFESVKTAQQVTVDEIPLPQMPEQPSSGVLPPDFQHMPSMIYTIANALKLQAMGLPMREPNTCPSGPPPDLHSDGEETDFPAALPDPDRLSDDDEETSSSEDDDGDFEPVSKPTSLQQKMVEISGQNIDEFMKEMETVHKQQDETVKHPEIIVPPGTDPIPSIQTLIRPPPPTLIYPGTLRLPPGPPPGRPLMPPPRLPPIRLPAGAPPRIIRLPGPPPPNISIGTPNVVSAGPQLISASLKPQSATISAKPQIRNLSADVTRFVPSTLRVKREDKKMKSSARTALLNELKEREILSQAAITARPQTKDDAYMQFMKEMQGLL